MIHHFSPFLLKFTDDFGIRWYGFSYLLGFICAYLVISWLAHRQRNGMTGEMVSDFITYVAVGTLVGGRLGYALFYSPDLFYKVKSSFPFWGLLAVNEGGMASHGGIIGIILACLIFAHKHHLNRLYLLDLVAVAGPIGVFFGRIANFINGELVGRVCAPDFALAVRFPSDIMLWPNQEFARLSSLSGVVEKIGVTTTEWAELLSKFSVDAASRDKVWSILQRIVVETQNDNGMVLSALGPVLDPRHPSQLYAAMGEGLLTFLILFLLWYKPRKPGVIASCFVVVYAIVRISDEMFRTPDAHLGFQALGLTRGQWLSIVMLFVGLVMLFFNTRGTNLPTSGWGLGQNVRLHRK